MKILDTEADFSVKKMVRSSHATKRKRITNKMGSLYYRVKCVKNDFVIVFVGPY
jgi:hypothetical protein